MEDLIFRVVKPMTPYTNFTYLTTSPPPGGAFWVFPPRPSLCTCRKTQTLLAITVFGLLTKQTELGCSVSCLNLSCHLENQQEIPTNCTPAALGNVSNGCWCIHFSRAPTKTCAFWSLMTFNSGRWNCSLWGRKWHFPFRGAKTSYDGVCFHFQTVCWIFVMGH